MKKTLLFAGLMLIIALGGHAQENKNHVIKNQPVIVDQSKQSFVPVEKLSKEAMLLNYAWYTDPDLTDADGNYCDVNTELTWLRNSWPNNAYFVNPPTGYAWRFGYYPMQPIVVIYSYTDPYQLKQATKNR